jgi:hypothetical protein
VSNCIAENAPGEMSKWHDWGQHTGWQSPPPVVAHVIVPIDVCKIGSFGKESNGNALEFVVSEIENLEVDQSSQSILINGLKSVIVEIQICELDIIGKYSWFQRLEFVIAV